MHLAILNGLNEFGRWFCFISKKVTYWLLPQAFPQEGARAEVQWVGFKILQSAREKASELAVFRFCKHFPFYPELSGVLCQHQM